MAEEDQDRLNFYSKYTRAKQCQGIDSLYTLIHGAKSTSSLEIHVFSRNDRRSQISRKSSVSPLPKKLMPRRKHKEQAAQESDQIERRNMEEINEKMLKLKKLQRDFHEEMARRESEMRKRKQSRDIQRRQRQKYKNNFINVVDNKQSPSRKESTSSRRKYSRDPHQHEVPAENLDFEDYYRDSAEVRISNAYQPTPETSRQIREMIEMQKIREKEVQSVDEEQNGKPNASIVIERVDIRGQAFAAKPVKGTESKNLCEVELSHSRSENTLDQYRFGKKQIDEIFEPKDEHDDFQSSQQSPRKPSQEEQYSPAQNLNFSSNNEQFKREERFSPKNEQFEIWPPSAAAVKQVESMEVIGEPMATENAFQHQYAEKNRNIANVEQDQSQRYSEQQVKHSPTAVRNKTGTQQGSQFKDEIEDKVGPIANRSQQFAQQPQRNTTGGHLFHSQTNPTPHLQVKKEVESIAGDALDFHPFEAPRQSSSQKKRLENKKSSFKKLMAENRANLVPRMAISTILNEKINEALGDLKNQNVQPVASPSLQQSIIKSEVSSPPSKRKVNFKRRIVQQQLDKSHSRESKPSFERDPSRITKNRNMLVGFFADN